MLLSPSLSLFSRSLSLSLSPLASRSLPSLRLPSSLLFPVLLLVVLSRPSAPLRREGSSLTPTSVCWPRASCPFPFSLPPLWAPSHTGNLSPAYVIRARERDLSLSSSLRSFLQFFGVCVFSHRLLSPLSLSLARFAIPRNSFSHPPPPSPSSSRLLILCHAFGIFGKRARRVTTPGGRKLFGSRCRPPPRRPTREPTAIYMFTVVVVAAVRAGDFAGCCFSLLSHTHGVCVCIFTRAIIITSYLSRCC